MDIGIGATLSYGGNAIGKIKRITLPGYTRNLTDATNLSSANNLKEWLPAIRDWEPCTFTTYADPVASGDTTNYYSSLVAALTSDTAATVIVTFPNGTTATFTGLVVGFRPNIGGEEDVVETEVTIKPTGAVVIANAA